MNKNKIKVYSLLGILFLIVNLIVFSVPILRQTIFWISYSFTVVAFVIQFIFWTKILVTDDNLKKKFIGFSEIHIGIIYLVLQLATFTIFIVFHDLPIWSCILGNGIILLIFALLVIFTSLGKDQIVKTEENVKVKVYFIKNLSLEIELLSSQVQLQNIKKKLNELNEIVKYSDPMSAYELNEIETEIFSRVNILKNNINSKEEDNVTAINQIIALMQERNKKCILLK